MSDPNLASLGAALDAAHQTGKSQETERTGQGTRSAVATGSSAPNDDVHLSELVRSLRSLAANSPERQARLEQITRAYASGNYHIDTKATASKIIDDAIET